VRQKDGRAGFRLRPAAPDAIEGGPDFVYWHRTARIVEDDLRAALQNLRERGWISGSGRLNEPALLLGRALEKKFRVNV
jgi:hypothetical protein